MCWLADWAQCRQAGTDTLLANCKVGLMMVDRWLGIVDYGLGRIVMCRVAGFMGMGPLIYGCNGGHARFGNLARTCCCWKVDYSAFVGICMSLFVMFADHVEIVMEKAAVDTGFGNWCQYRVHLAVVVSDHSSPY